MTDPSIKRDLIVSLAAALLILYSLSATGVYFFVSSKARVQFDAALRNEVHDFTEETKIDRDGAVEAEFHKIDLPRYRQGAEDSFYQLWNHAGETILKSASMATGEDLPLSATVDGEIDVTAARLADGTRVRVARVQFPLNTEADAVPPGYDPARPENRVTLAVAHSEAEMRGTLATLASALTVSGLLLAACGVITVLGVVKRGLRPLDRFAVITEALDPDHLGERLPEEASPAELRPFLRQINAMLDRVEAGFERERRFSTSVAHELRTPVAELRTLVEVALTESDDPELDENPDDVYRSGLAIAKRMGTLIDGLSQLLRGAPGPGLQPDAIAASTVSAAVRESMACHVTDAVARGIRIRLEMEGGDENEEGVAIAADGALVRAILDNLIANAGAHAPENSEVVVRARLERGNAYEIAIANARGDLTDVDLGRMTEPFWQKDAARTDPNRFGLGLPLAAAYAELMGADLTLALKGGQFVATLRLPVARTPDRDGRAAPADSLTQMAAE